MLLYINNRKEEVPTNVSNVAQLITYLKLKEQGTAVGLNSHFISKDKWEITDLKDNDNLVIISAAFGG